MAARYHLAVNTTFAFTSNYQERSVELQVFQGLDAQEQPSIIVIATTEFQNALSNMEIVDLANNLRATGVNYDHLIMYVPAIKGAGEAWVEDLTLIQFHETYEPQPGLIQYRGPHFSPIDREDVDRLLNQLFYDYNQEDPLLPAWPKRQLLLSRWLTRQN